MSQLQCITLQSPNSETKVYLESHNEDIYLNAQGWISKEQALQLAQYIHTHLRTHS